MIRKYRLYKQIGGRKTYLAVEMDSFIASDADTALSIADEYFKAGKKNLICTTGRVIDKDLYLAETKGEYPNPLAVEKYDVWVITRK